MNYFNMLMPGEKVPIFELWPAHRRTGRLDGAIRT